MRYKVFSIRDRAADVFGQPFFQNSTGAAIRVFHDAINNKGPDNLYYNHPDDFDLYELGTFDDDIGVFDTGNAKQISIGKDIKVRE